MPTGYTAAIKDGITFNQFALNCARAFGALVLMRDDPADAPIPDKIEPSEYHSKAIAGLRAKLSDLNGMSATESANQAQAAFDEALASHNISLTESRKKYPASRFGTSNPCRGNRGQYGAGMSEDLMRCLPPSSGGLRNESAAYPARVCRKASPPLNCAATYTENSERQ